MRRALAVLILVTMALALAGCLKVRQTIELAGDGSGRTQIEFIIDKNYAGLVMPELRKMAQKEFGEAKRPGWRIEERSGADGSPVLVVAGPFRQVAELSDDDQVFSFATTRSGFFHDSHTFSYRQLRSQEMAAPVEIELEVVMPGAVVRSDGEKLASDRVLWRLSGMRRGQSGEVLASAVGLPNGDDMARSLDAAVDALAYRQIAIERRSEGLVMRSADGAERELANAGESGALELFTVTPAGDALYRITGGKQAGSYLLRVSDDRTVRLAHDIGGGPATLSPDGSTVAAMKGMWSGDGASYLVTLSDGTMTAVPPRALPGMSQVPAAADVGDGPAQWSADGRLLAFVRCVLDGPCAVVLYRPGDGSMEYVVRADGKPMMFDDKLPPELVHFAEDRLIFSEGASLWSFDMRVKKHLPVAADAYLAQVSPDGTKIAYADFAARQSFYVLDLASGKSQRIYTAPDGAIYEVGLAWSPDGTYLTYSWPDGAWRIRADRRNVRAEPLPGSPVLAPDDPRSPEFRRELRIPRASWAQPGLIRGGVLTISALVMLCLIAAGGLLARRVWRVVAVRRTSASATVTGPAITTPSATVFCTECGTRCNATARFCSRCGTALDR